MSDDLALPTQDPADKALMDALLAEVADHARDIGFDDPTVVLWAAPPVVVLRLRSTLGVGRAVIEVMLTDRVDAESDAIKVRDPEDVIGDLEAAVRCGAHFGIFLVQARNADPAEAS